MSNHSGSYMLNSVLLLLEERNFFATLQKTEIKSFMDQIISIGWEYDCNEGEILDDIGERLKFCYYCREFSEEFTDNLCKQCA